MVAGGPPVGSNPDTRSPPRSARREAPSPDPVARHAARPDRRADPPPPPVPPPPPRRPGGAPPPPPPGPRYPGEGAAGVRRRAQLPPADDRPVRPDREVGQRPRAQARRPADDRRVHRHPALGPA